MPSPLILNLARRSFSSIPRIQGLTRKVAGARQNWETLLAPSSGIVFPSIFSEYKVHRNLRSFEIELKQIEAEVKNSGINALTVQQEAKAQELEDALRRMNDTYEFLIAENNSPKALERRASIALVNEVADKFIDEVATEADTRGDKPRPY